VNGPGTAELADATGAGAAANPAAASRPALWGAEDIGAGDRTTSVATDTGRARVREILATPGSAVHANLRARAQNAYTDPSRSSGDSSSSAVRPSSSSFGSARSSAVSVSR